MMFRNKRKKNTLPHMDRKSEEWVNFVERQKLIIISRLNRYNHKPTIETQLAEIGDLTGYQRYKTSVVSPYLREALEIIEAGKYGICKSCECEIPIERLKVVPGAICCISCDSSKETKTA